MTLDCNGEPDAAYLWRFVYVPNKPRYMDFIDVASNFAWLSELRTGPIPPCLSDRVPFTVWGNSDRRCAIAKHGNTVYWYGDADAVIVTTRCNFGAGLLPVPDCDERKA